MKTFKPLIYATSLGIMAAPLATLADDHDELEFEEAQLYFELNDTDGDLGLHGKVDGDGWQRVVVEGPNERYLLQLKAKSGLKRQGMTELFFESSEPTFDELDPGDFFARFPQGAYEWEGETLDGDEIEGEAYLSHVIPAAPVVASVGAKTENPGFEEGDGELEKVCWEGIGDMDGGVVIAWEPVMQSHYDKWSVDPQPLLTGEASKIPLGISGDVEVLYYEFVAEVDDTDFKVTALIPAGVNEWTIPAEFIDMVEGLEVDGETVEEIKFEVIVRGESGGGLDDDGDTVESGPGNQSAVEDCFELDV